MTSGPIRSSAKVKKCRLTLPLRASQGKQAKRAQTFERMVCETARWSPQRIPPLRGARVGQPIRSHAVLARYRLDCIELDGWKCEAMSVTPCRNLRDGMGFSVLWAEATLAGPHRQREGARHRHELASAPPCCAGRQSTTYNLDIFKIKYIVLLSCTDALRPGNRRR